MICLRRRLDVRVQLRRASRCSLGREGQLRYPEPRHQLRPVFTSWASASSSADRGKDVEARAGHRRGSWATTLTRSPPGSRSRRRSPSSPGGSAWHKAQVTAAG
jgi:hypothetical protein